MFDIPAVFLPGTLCDGRVFSDLLRLFKTSVTVDLRTPSSIPEMLSVIEQLPFKQFVLIGFSMGGHIAQEYALMSPERVAKLVILSASSEGYPVEEKQRILKMLPFVKSAPFSGITDRRLRDFLHPTSFEIVAIRKTIQDMAGTDAKEVYLRQLEATLERRNLLEPMSHYQSQTLFVSGKQDAIVPFESVERSSKNCPSARLVGIDECGHFPTLEKSELTCSAVKDFLARV